MDDGIIKSDLAVKLLNSPDEKVAAAASRIFFSTELSGDHESSSSSSQNNRENKSSMTATSSLLIHKFGKTVPSDIEEAAKTVAMMAPKKHTIETSTKELPSDVPVATTIKVQLPTQKSLAVQHVAVSSLTSDTPLQQSTVTISQEPQSRAVQVTKLPPLPVKRLTTTDERLQRSRERNKMHARKTRQRKKEHMNQLENRVQTLKQHQISVKLLIKEKNTANILLGMTNGSFSMEPAASSSTAVDPKVDDLLKRSTDDIPDSTKIPDLPALILPGNHNKRRRLDSGAVSSNVQQEYPNDGIDYELLGKDRTACTPEELDKIRKERNRMHAKRTRDRKRIFMEEMEKIIKQLEVENDLLEKHLAAITSDAAVSSSSSTPSSGRATPSLNSPMQKSSCPTVKPPTEMLQSNGESTSENHQLDLKVSVPQGTSQKVIQENVSPTLNMASSVICSPQHTSVQGVKGSSLPLPLLTSSGVSTVSMSPTPHETRNVNQGESSPVVVDSRNNPVGRKASPEPLQLPPASITTTSEAPIRCK